MNNGSKFCRKCKEEINIDAKKCPHCGSKQGINFFIPIALIFLFVLIFGPSDDETKPEEMKGAEVEVIKFVDMKKDEINLWCDENKVVCVFKQDYSDTVDNKKFIDQSVEAEETIYEGEEIVLTYSLGKEPSTEFKNALKKAESYSDNMHMSKNAIYEQLVSEYGEQFPEDAAKYAIENLDADWNENALKKAKSYQENMSMSKSSIYDQLISEYGEDFTKEQAQYAIDHLEE